MNLNRQLTDQPMGERWARKEDRIEDMYEGGMGWGMGDGGTAWRDGYLESTFALEREKRYISSHI